MRDWPEWPVCATEALPGDGALAFEVGEGDWPLRGFLVHRGGVLRAYANICPHKRYPLNLAEHDFLVPGQALLRCAHHGALFEVETGLCLVGPCAGRRLLALELREDGGRVLVRAPESLTAGLAALDGP